MPRSTITPANPLDDATASGGGGPSRVEAAFVKARRHSRQVRLLKIALPTAAILMAAAFIGYSSLSLPSGVSVDIAGSAIRDGKVVMANPKLSGFNRDNEPYTMNARRAIQDLKETGQIELEEISARLPLDGDVWAEVDAERGIYDKDANTLDVVTPMTITTTDGMIALLANAFIELGAGGLKTGDPVDVTRDGSRITADSLVVSERGKVFVFENRVRVMMMPDKVRTAEAGVGSE